jgi:hypothetical protein
MLRFFQALSMKGWSRIKPAQYTCRGKPIFSTRLDREKKIALPWAAFLGRSTMRGSLLRAPE